ncbi:methyltransferase family protein [Actinomadura decatromicini]|uniref:Isoprenylcysteine carboxylmethyltransferase family protein n=1 Tax=Actinomadura decatromicini TaxID=2604572 RepID=A0A5D3FFZ9_9ACTN|nr:isoprenylcysteine carboxylmethyltransferase family protein [Actinomadura decatromicini]TYK46902.1 isoprenylcysteine carboxylmethyltransferase family protein [Actinomadura decatromicini]
MRTPSVTLGSALFFAAAPGVVAGLTPLWLTGWRPRHHLLWPVPLRITGIVLVTAGSLVLIHAFVRFVTEGLGTPAPIAPTRHLVVGGLYRHVRNPMYLAVITTIAGQTLILQRGILLWYLATATAVMVAFVHLYEQPALRARFGTQYEQYVQAVPAWLPRLRPFHPDDRPGRPAAD